MLFKEGTAINKSLLFLGIVISALSRGLRCVPPLIGTALQRLANSTPTCDSHAPFRDSRLTLILKVRPCGNWCLGDVLTVSRTVWVAILGRPLFNVLRLLVRARKSLFQPCESPVA